jgi:AbrB family looped-hinge helix DNA binding protein
MTLATITSKGQTTIPKEFRDRLNLRANERIAFELRGEELVIRRVGASIDELAGSLSTPVAFGGKKAERAAVPAHLAKRHKR